MNADLLEKSFDRLAERLQGVQPRQVCVLGSGWDPAAGAFETTSRVSYADIPLLGGTAVAGHAGTVDAVSTRAGDCLFFRGRRHRYECDAWEPVVFPAFAAARFGARTLFLTNAAGSIRADLQPGNLMAIDDHINAMGGNPLAGPHAPVLGDRFPDLTSVYTPTLRTALDAAAAGLDRPLRHGVYLAVDGPTYETPAEVRAYAALGAHAIGMSTVPEAIVGAAMGLQVAAVSCITNAAAGPGTAALSHADVIEVAQRAAADMAALVTAFLGRLGP